MRGTNYYNRKFDHMGKVLSEVDDPMVRRELRKIISDQYKRGLGRTRDRLASSLMQEERWREDDDGYGSGRYYGFITGLEDATDEEVEECVGWMVVRICSDYDCTGRWFTQWIDWHRNPTGLVSYIHAMALDI